VVEVALPFQDNLVEEDTPLEDTCHLGAVEVEHVIHHVFLKHNLLQNLNHHQIKLLYFDKLFFF
jgi:hypothetical protein